MFLVSAILLVIVLRPEELSSSGSTRSLVAVVDRTGAVELLALQGSGIVTSISSAPAASAGVETVTYGEDLVIQRLVNGELRVLSLESDGLVESIVWEGGDAGSLGNVIDSFEYDSTVTFLLSSGIIRSTSLGLDEPATLRLWPLDQIEVVNAVGIDRLLFLRTAADRILAVDPEEPSTVQELLNSPTAIRQLTTDDDRLLVLLADDSVHEYDPASGIWSVLFEDSDTAAFSGPRTLGGGWFAVDQRSGSDRQITDGITSAVLSDTPEIESLHGERFLERVTWKREPGEDGTGGKETRDVANVFVMIGAVPNSAWLKGCVTLDERGFVLSGIDVDGARPSSPFTTSVEGIYAVGDVRSGSVKRVASGVGEGSVCIQSVHRWLAEQGDSDEEVAAE